MNTDDVMVSSTSGLLSIVVPICNEKECFPLLLQRLMALTGRLKGHELELIFVNDGSNDGTASLLNEAATQSRCVKIIHFSRNFGHQAALTAGFDHADGDFVCVIDADLQDPPELIPDMLLLALQGYDVVYGKRRNRSGESWFKKTTASLFYKFLTTVCRVDIPTDTGDFRLVSRRVVQSLRKLREAHRFVRGLVPWVGFRSTALLYDRQDRHAGYTKYPFVKMVHFATDAILSFSNFPLRVSTFVGLGMTALSLVGIIAVLYLRLFTTFTVPGISAVLCLMLLISGIQFIILGMMGEYIGRIYEQTKGRPLYLVASTSNINLRES